MRSGNLEGFGFDGNSNYRYVIVSLGRTGTTTEWALERRTGFHGDIWVRGLVCTLPRNSTQAQVVAAFDRVMTRAS